MNIIDLRKFKRILLVGYGIEGKSTHAFLKKFLPEIEVGIADKNDDPNYLDQQKNYELAIKTPGIPKNTLTIPHTTATNIFLAQCGNRTIGITGTKGKSTTSQLLYEFFVGEGIPSVLAGNIGAPMLDLLTHDVLKPEHTVILELSSYQLDDIEYSPHISVVLNIEEAHLDYHGGFDEYKNAKLRIAEYAVPNDKYLYNKSQPELAQAHTNAQIIPFLDSGIMYEGIHKDTLDAVFTVASTLGVPTQNLTQAVKNFHHLPHRLELVGTYKGISFIDDSASTAPSATIFALESLHDVDTLICGGLHRNHTFEHLAQAIINAKVKNLVIFPTIEEGLISSLGKYSENLNILKTDSMKGAVEFSFKHTESGKKCLLSPGFASYNMYSGFPERGNDFQNNIKLYEEASQA